MSNEKDTLSTTQQVANGHDTVNSTEKEWISDTIGSVNPDNIQQVAASNLKLNDKYCQSIIKQANRSFWSALFSALAGLLVFLAGAIFLVISKQDTVQISLITGLSAAITALVSGTGFYLYTHAMKHFEAFHLCLARTEIVLLENSICKRIENQEKRDSAYASVVENIENLAVLITSYKQENGRAARKVEDLNQPQTNKS